MVKHGDLGIWGVPTHLGAGCADDRVVVLVGAEEAVCPGELLRGSRRGDVNLER